MEKEITLNSKNIDAVIRQIKKANKKLLKQPSGIMLFFNPYKSVLNRNRYRGMGRPHKTDYDRVLDEELVKALKENGFVIIENEYLST